MILNSAEKFSACSRYNELLLEGTFENFPHVLWMLWHMKEVPCKKFIIIRKQLVYSPKWSQNQQPSATVSEINNYRELSAKDSIAYGFLWWLRTFASSNSIGPENFLQIDLVPKPCVHKIEILDLTGLHDEISTWLHYAGFPPYVVSHVSDFSSIASSFVLYEPYSNPEQL